MLQANPGAKNGQVSHSALRDGHFAWTGSNLLRAARRRSTPDHSTDTWLLFPSRGFGAANTTMLGNDQRTQGCCGLAIDTIAIVSSFSSICTSC